MDFHDAFLVRLRVEWNSGCVVLELETPSGRAELHLDGVRELVVPRRQPWGPSSYVNLVEFSPGAVVVEMQSGDRLEVDCAAVHVRRAMPTWGDIVKVRDDSDVHPAECGAVCGVHERGADALVLIEFSDGSSVELPTTDLELVAES